MSLLQRSCLRVLSLPLHKQSRTHGPGLVAFSSRTSTLANKNHSNFLLDHTHHASVSPFSGTSSRKVATYRDKQHRFKNVSPSPYRPRRPSLSKRQPENESSSEIPPDVLFYGIMIANGAVFMAWGVAKASASSGDTKSIDWMMNNFTNSYRNLAEGRIWTLVTACFSHESVSHLLFNGFTYYYFAKPVLEIIGSARFLSLYLGGGIFAGLVSLYWNASLKERKGYSSHGASAAIYALLSFVACVSPTSKVLLYGFIPLPIWLVVTGVFLYDGYSEITNKKTQTDSVGHLSGLIAGIVYYLSKRYGAPW